MFNIEENNMAYIVLFASPSALKTPYKELDKIIRMEPNEMMKP